MKNVPRMMDYERAIAFDSALGADTMILVNKPDEKFNGSISNLMHLIESSFDWSKNYPSDGSDMRYEIPIHTNEDIKNVSKRTSGSLKHTLFTSRQSVPAFINTQNLPKGYCENKYVQAYIYQVGGRFLRAWSIGDKLTAQDISNMTRKHSGLVDGDKWDRYDNNYRDYINHLNKEFIHIFHLWKFQREEQNLFLLEDQNLIDALAKTEYDCRTDWLRSPNDSIYIMLPENKYNFEGMYVNLEGVADGNKYLRIYMPKRSNKKDRKTHPMGNESHYWSNNIKKSMNLQESIRAGIAESVHVADGIDRDDNDLRKDNDIMTYYSNLAAQALLYITSENREAVLNRVPKKIISVNRKKKFISREKTQTDYWALGGNDTIYIRNSKRVNPKDGTLIVNKGTGKKLDHLTLVPAHFHGYWRKRPSKIAELKEYQIIEEKYDDMGKRMVLYKKWLKPYYKGHGELVVKEYKLTTGGYEKEYIEEEVDSE